MNRDGIFLKSIGHKRLKSFAKDYLELLGTSSAIYEANGHYAFGIFASGWCRMMDRASRTLCSTPDNVEALNSGRWLCHESCWTDCSKEAIARRAPVDIECNGGIRLYAVPIFAGGNVIGAINFGYGDPPKDPEKVKRLTDVFNLKYDDLLCEATAYDSRPPYIIEMAKKRLSSTAKNFNPHLHAIATDGCFLDDGSFKVAPGFVLEDLEEIFQYEVLKMLKKEGKINDAIVENMLSWRHSGFNVYIGDRIYPSDNPRSHAKTGLGNLARYIIRACFSQERMVYVPAEESADGVAKVVYTSKDKKSRKIFNALDWLARLVTHNPGRYEQTVRYYGRYSNKSRGMRKKAGTDDTIPAVMPNELSSKESKQNWARLIQKIYEVDPLVCPKCQGSMKIIEELDLIEKILCHLNLWDVCNHDPSQKVSDYILELVCDAADSRIPELESWY